MSAELEEYPTVSNTSEPIDDDAEAVHYQATTSSNHNQISEPVGYFSSLTFESIRRIVSPFENGQVPRHMIMLVLVNFVGLFAHLAKSVYSNRQNLVVNAARFVIHATLLAVPALLFPVPFFFGFSAVIVYRYNTSTSGQIYMF